MNPPVVVYQAPLGSPNSPSSLGTIRRGTEFVLDQLAGAGEPELEKILSPGDAVIIKPNFVTTMNYHLRLDPWQQEAVTTNLALIRVIIERALRAVGPSGRIIVADSPIEAVDFSAVMDQLGVTRMIGEMRSNGMPVELLDIRDRRVLPLRLVDDFQVGNRSLNIGCFRKQALPGDPRGYVHVDLGNESRFEEHPSPKRLRFYHPHFRRPLEAHQPGRHVYCVSRTVLEARLIINLPKLKTHKISGVTLAQKNLIGLMNKKFWLPHFSQGHPPNGDQFDRKLGWMERLQNLLRVIPIGFGSSVFIRFPRVDGDQRAVRMPIYNGSWIGNDTLWRTILDVARVVEYADLEGRVHKEPQRHVLSIMDGMIGGEGNGPLGATPKPCGVLLGSFHMAPLDVVATRMMGLRPEGIKYLEQAAAKPVEVIGNVDSVPRFSFAPPGRWELLVY